MSLCISVAIPQTEEAVGLMAVAGPVAGVNAGAHWAGQSKGPVLEKLYICFPLLQLQYKECLTQTTKPFVAQNYQHLNTKEIQP